MVSDTKITSLMSRCA